MNRPAASFFRRTPCSGCSAGSCCARPDGLARSPTSRTAAVWLWASSSAAGRACGVRCVDQRREVAEKGLQAQRDRDISGELFLGLDASVDCPANEFRRLRLTHGKSSNELDCLLRTREARSRTQGRRYGGGRMDAPLAERVLKKIHKKTDNRLGIDPLPLGVAADAIQSANDALGDSERRNCGMVQSSKQRLTQRAKFRI